MCLTQKAHSVRIGGGEAEREGRRESRRPRPPGPSGCLSSRLSSVNGWLLPRAEFSAPCHLLRGAVPQHVAHSKCSGKTCWVSEWYEHPEAETPEHGGCVCISVHRRLLAHGRPPGSRRLSEGSLAVVFPHQSPHLPSSPVSHLLERLRVPTACSLRREVIYHSACLLRLPIHLITCGGTGPGGRLPRPFVSHRRQLSSLPARRPLLHSAAWPLPLH